MNTVTQLLEETARPVDVDSLDTAKPLAVIFEPYQTVLAKWEAKAQSLVVTDISQKTEMAQARLARLELKEARVTMDKTRKGLVEKLKARTGAIDGAARVIREKLEELEAKLLESEEFADRHRAKLKAEIKVKREAELIPLLEGPLLGDLSDLSDADYAKALSDAKLLKQAKIDAAAKAEADRIAKEKADAEERERVRLENERLKKEAIEREAAAKAEREAAAAQAKADADRAAAALAELEAKAKAHRERADAAAKEQERLAQIERKKATEAARIAEVERLAAAVIAADERREIENKAAAAAKAAADKAAKEQAALEAKARQEKEAADAVVAKERAAREKAEADAQALRDAEKKKKDAAVKAAKEAAAAPENAKLAAFAVALRGLTVPQLKSQPEIEADLHTRISNLALWCDNQAARI